MVQWVAWCASAARILRESVPTIRVLHRAENSAACMMPGNTRVQCGVVLSRTPVESKALIISLMMPLPLHAARRLLC